jgi:hypothetical protein
MSKDTDSDSDSEARVLEDTAHWLGDLAVVEMPAGHGSGGGGSAGVGGGSIDIDGSAHRHSRSEALCPLDLRSAQWRAPRARRCGAHSWRTITGGTVGAVGARGRGAPDPHL